MKLKVYSKVQARRDIPERKYSDNKTRGGKCLVIAGSNGMWGAAVLCAKAALRSGTGYVYLFDKTITFPICKNPDFLLIDKLDQLANYQSIAIGPGLHNQKFIEKCILKLVQKKYSAVVLDAEALNTIAKMKNLPKLPANWILTPHEGELSRLLDVSSKKIKVNRKKYALAAQKKFGCVVLLKGFRTVVTNSKEIWEISAGNSSLSKAGTGDVLTGIIAGFLSQNMEPLRAACLAAYVHGTIADKWIADGNDHLSLMASDLLTMLPQILVSVRSKTKTAV